MVWEAFGLLNWWFGHREELCCVIMSRTLLNCCRQDLHKFTSCDGLKRSDILTPKERDTKVMGGVLVLFFGCFPAYFNSTWFPRTLLAALVVDD